MAVISLIISGPLTTIIIIDIHKLLTSRLFDLRRLECDGIISKWFGRCGCVWFRSGVMAKCSKNSEIIRFAN